MKIIPFLSIIIFSILASCTDRPSWQKEQGMIWNTIWRATYEGTPEMWATAMDSLDATGASLSAFDRNSIVSRINQADSMQVDQHLRKVYEMSVIVNRRSDGMFDPTIGPLIKAWGFGQGHTPTSDTARIDQLLLLTGISNTRIENGRMMKRHPDMSFNFSAIAKGYGVDMAGEALKAQGSENYMIEIGGEIVCRGKNPEGKPWRILIETPDREFIEKEFSEANRPEFMGEIVVNLSDEALATSGNYRNYYENKNGTYGHTISPLTGRPVHSDILSASVIAPTCMEADAMATACMALGSAKAAAMLEKANLPGLFILDSGKVLMTPLMKSHIVK